LSEAGSDQIKKKKKKNKKILVTSKGLKIKNGAVESPLQKKKKIKKKLIEL
jgi:hypothetical protein